MDIFNETNDELEKTIRYLVPYLIPTSYLENYDYLKSTATEIKWPKRPQAIVTSNAYDFNELFKIWAASKIEQGTKNILFSNMAHSLEMLLDQRIRMSIKYVINFLIGAQE